MTCRSAETPSKSRDKQNWQRADIPKSVYTLSSRTPSSPAHLTALLRVSSNALRSLRLFADLSPFFLLRDGNERAI